MAHRLFKIRLPVSIPGGGKIEKVPPNSMGSLTEAFATMYQFSEKEPSSLFIIASGQFGYSFFRGGILEPSNTEVTKYLKDGQLNLIKGT